MGVLRTPHLRQVHGIPYTARAPNKAIRGDHKNHTVDSLLTQARLRLWASACRDPPHRFVRATVFGLVEHEDPKRRPHMAPTHQGQIKDAVQQLQDNSLPSDWSLDPDLLADAKDAKYCDYVEGPNAPKRRFYLPGDPVVMGTHDPPTLATHAEFLYLHLGPQIRGYREAAGIHPTKSLEAVTHLALRPKLFYGAGLKMYFIV